MTTQISIDLETLGTNVDSQILSIGACEFNAAGEILDEFYVVIELPEDTHMNVTAGTLNFWLSQPADARAAIWDAPVKVPLELALGMLHTWLSAKSDIEMWANGTKFDLGMLEYQCKLYRIYIPWPFNADRDMRTIRKFARGLHIEVDYEGIAHHALHDAIWQAKYIAAACNRLGLVLEQH